MANLERRQLGELDCQVITADRSPLLTVVFCHGFGAPGDDLVPVGAQLLQQFPELLDQVEIVFPAAPLTLDDYGIPGGRAWWPLDMERLNLAAERGNYDGLRREVPEQLPQAREKLLGTIKTLKESGDPHRKFVLGGFSQGAMLATDVSMQLETPPEGLVIWSGTLINETDWTARVKALKGIPVIQSHGREDPLLPYEAAIWLRDLLLTADAKVNFIGFRGAHTIPKDAVNEVGQLLQRLAGVIE